MSCEDHMHSDNNGRVPEIKGKNKKKSVENINETHEPAKANKYCFYLAGL